jgi:O-methyltransferase
MTVAPPTVFPFDLMLETGFPGPLGELVRKVGPWSLQPPYPWASWCYARLLDGRLREVGGGYAELGVGLGGTSLLLGLIAREQGRTVLSYDSFVGLPAPHQQFDNDYFKDGFYRSEPERANLLTRFQRAVDRFGLTETVRPVPGFFADTLTGPDAPKEPLAFVHLDSDLYDSVTQSLEAVFDLVPTGGAVVVDDFFHPAQGPARALSDFCNRRGLTPLLHVTFPYSVLFFKGEEPGPADRRAIDGNYYALDLVRDDPVLCEAVARGTDATERSAGARARLLRLLREPEPGYADIYEYWRCLEYFWQRIDYRPPDDAVWMI